MRSLMRADFFVQRPPLLSLQGPPVGYPACWDPLPRRYECMQAYIRVCVYEDIYIYMYVYIVVRASCI